MNGLVSDVQMFAHEKLQIPLPGRHLPSPFLLNGGSSSDRYHLTYFLLMSILTPIGK